MNNIQKIVKKYTLELIFLVCLLPVIARCLHSVTGIYFPVYHKHEFKLLFWIINYFSIFLVYLIYWVSSKNELIKSISILITFGMAGVIVGVSYTKDITYSSIISVIVFTIGVVIALFRQINLKNKY